MDFVHRYDGARRTAQGIRDGQYTNKYKGRLYFRTKETVSRVLFRPNFRAAMIIHLGQTLPTASSDRTRRLQASNLSPTSSHHASGRSKMGTPPYLVLLRVGFTESRCHHRDWCALTAPFHPYQAQCTAVIRSTHGLGGLFSVALSLGSPPLDVIQHPALRSPDFPPFTWQRRAIIWPPSSQKVRRCSALSVHSCSAIESGGTERFGGQYL